MRWAVAAVVVACVVLAAGTGLGVYRGATWALATQGDREDVW